MSTLTFITPQEAKANMKYREAYEYYHNKVNNEIVRYSMKGKKYFTVFFNEDEYEDVRWKVMKLIMDELHELGYKIRRQEDRRGVGISIDWD